MKWRTCGSSRRQVVFNQKTRQMGDPQATKGRAADGFAGIEPQAAAAGRALMLVYPTGE